ALRGLVPGAVVAASVLAVASSALSGARRVVIPADLACGFTVLAQIAAVPWERAGASLGEFQRDLADARAAHGGAAAYLVVDPPRSAGDAGGANLELLLDPAIC